MKTPPLFFHIAPLLAGREEEVARDTVRLVRETPVDGVAFSCSLHPEGDPPLDKAAAYAARLLAMKRALAGSGVPFGVLVQSTMGHGYPPDSPPPFQRLALRDGRTPWVCCPLDPGFLAHIRAQVAALVARVRPDFVVIDDDARLGSGYGGCLCPLHRAAYAARRAAGGAAAEPPSFEALAAALEAGDPAVQRAFDETQAESMERFFRAVRAGIDEADPALPAVLCSCGYEMPLAPRFAAILAAPGQRRTVRLNNGRYNREGLRDIPFWLHGTAWQLAQAEPGMAVLGEPDTCPHNRYSTAAAVLHYHLALSLLEGCAGAKLWLTRTAEWEPESGAAYRRLLSENAGFYRALAALRPTWEGLRIPLARTASWGIDWGSSLFGRFGYPYAHVAAFGEEDGAAAPPPRAPTALSEHDVLVLSDAALRAVLRGRALLDGGAALALARRGFGPLVGVEARPWEGRPTASFETWDGGRVNRAVFPVVDLRAAAPGAVVLSELRHRPWALAEESVPLGPGAVLFDNADGGRVLSVAFSVPPLTRELWPFHALGQTRKRLLADGLRRLCGGDDAAWCGGVRYEGDAELLLRVGTSAAGERLWVAMNLGLDPLPDLPLALAEGAAAPVRAERLAPDGAWAPVAAAPAPRGLRLRHTLAALELAVFRVAFP